MKRYLSLWIAPAVLGAAASGCAPPGQPVRVGRIVNRAAAEARLTLAPARNRTAWVAAAVGVMSYRPAIRTGVARAEARVAPARPMTSTRLARARIKPSLSEGFTAGTSTKGQVAVARAKGTGVTKGHKSEVSVNQRKGLLVLNSLKAQLHLTKTATRNAIFPGDRITYVLTAANVSELPVTGLVITDEYPDELQLVRVSRFRSRNSPAAAGGGVVTVSVPGELPVGQTVSFEITFRLTDKARLAFAQSATPRQ